VRALKVLETDKRVKMMNEILNGIRIIKFYAWESAFRDRVEKVRLIELKLIRKIAYIIAIAFSLVLMAVPTFLPVLIFYTYVRLGNQLDAAKAFTAISLFNLLQFPFLFLPLGEHLHVDVCNCSRKSEGVLPCGGGSGESYDCGGYGSLCLLCGSLVMWMPHRVCVALRTLSSSLYCPPKLCPLFCNLTYLAVVSIDAGLTQYSQSRVSTARMLAFLELEELQPYVEKEEGVGGVVVEMQGVSMGWVEPTAAGAEGAEDAGKNGAAGKLLVLCVRFCKFYPCG
jgi:ABC-type multidrug transport system fused ATPase/permease subunit